jgi:VacB/RNase II family 3'-5' exoribonuclease
VNLDAIAHNIATQRGFEPDFGADVEREVAAVRPPDFRTLPAGVRDLRELPWSSIDNQESMDLDQIEVASRLPNDAIQVLIGIADVDSLVPRGGAVDAHAARNCTSVYTGVVVFPMLPRQLSESLTSLLPDQDRLAIVIELVVEKDGTVSRHDLYRALVRNKFKLVYESVGAWLERADGTGAAAAPSGDPATVASLPKTVTDQLTLQREAARRLKEERLRAGALELDTIEARPVMQNGRIVDLAVVRKNLARDLIEDFMIAANIASAKFLEAHGSSGIRRVVREPERWARIVDLARLNGEQLPESPDAPALAGFLSRMHAKDPLRFPDLSLSVVKLLGRGEYKLDLPGKDPGIHFGLAAHDYSHTTAPNRRYADLIQQRLVKAVLAKAPQPYSNDELAAIASHATEMEDAAQKVERQMRKVVAAGFLKNKVGQTFDGIVTGATSKGTYVRLLHPPAEGRVIEAEQGMDVGDRVKVKLVGVNQERGFIDFAGAR